MEDDLTAADIERLAGSRRRLAPLAPFDAGVAQKPRCAKAL
jgi:hypothetical protein